MHRIAILAVEGAVGLELTSAAHVFALAADPVTGKRLYDVLVCGRSGGSAVTAGGREILRAELPYAMEDALSADTVVVTASSIEPADAVEIVRRAHEGGARIASICTGAFVLGAAGLLDGRRATTHWAHAVRLAKRFPAVDVTHDELYVDEGDVLTSAGVTAGLDLCLHMVRRDHGSAVAALVARRMVMPPHRGGGQAQYLTSPIVAEGHSLQPVMHWMQEHLTEPLTLAKIAAQASMSTRTLSRQFRAQTGETPLRWLIRLRVHRAQELLEATDLGIEQVATACGFGTSVVLRQHFAKTLGTSPTAYRRTFAR
ncbi:GlxA family transcriptional regulator [Kribbella deserti]|uniref:GlxA family transcriptional regulator n=1 Tax=Kribbella deserti TaxID=1926257 RepID=A0ABV6QXG0_9ACTN